MKNIKHLLDVVDGVRDHVALGLMSDPGLSKTAQVKEWAEENNRRYCELIISQRMPSEISGMPMPVQDTQKMEIFDFQTLLELEDGDVLAFDEFTNGNIQTLNACLTLIQERTMLSGKKLPSLVIVAMGNPQGKCELLPQTKQRFWWVNVHLDIETWEEYMERKWDIVVHHSISDRVVDQYNSGFKVDDTYNYYTPRTMENLFRIAMTIDEQDSFWTVSDVPSAVVNGIYKSINGKTELDALKATLTEFWDNEAHPTSLSEDAIAILTDIQGARSIDEIRTIVRKVERTGSLDEFIDWLKTRDEEHLREPLGDPDTINKGGRGYSTRSSSM